MAESRANESFDQKNRRQLTLKDEKKLHLRKIIKDKIGMSNINDLVLCDKNFNGGMFGCLSGGEEGMSKVVPRKQHEDLQVSLG